MTQLIEVLNALGRWLVGHLWQLSIELAVLTVVVVVAIYVLRIKSPALRHAFWGLVLIKPLVTVLVASPLSMYSVLGRPGPEPAVVQPEARVGAEQPETPGPAAARAAGTRRGTMAERTEGAHPAIPVAVLLGLDGIVALAWLAVASVLGLRLLVGCAYVALLRQSATPHDHGPLHEAVEEALGQLRLRRRVGIATTGAVPGPTLTGVLRPVILLPQHLAEGLSRRQIRMIVMHELVHVRRWDNLVVLVQRAAEMLLFFHPVVWLCGWMMRREAEAACDDAVLAATGGSELYVDSLARVAEMSTGRPPALLVNGSVTAESYFAQRMRRILSGRIGRMTRRLTIASVIAMAAVAAIGLPTTSPQRMPRELQAVIDGLARREALFKSFEGCLTMVRFHGPASEDRSNWPDFAMTKFYAVDVPGNRWLSEWRWHYLDRRIGFKHQVSCFNGSVYARKGADDPYWNVTSEDDYAADYYGYLLRALLLHNSAEMAWDEMFAQLRNVAITEEQVDGATCLRIEWEMRPAEVPLYKARMVLWVDPERGYAIRKLASVLSRLGRSFHDQVWHAYDFREYPGGLWLPQRTKTVRCAYTGDPPVRTWEEVQTYEIAEAKVNEPLSRDYFASLDFPTDRQPRNPYEPKLTDDDPKQAKRREELLRRVNAGPGDASTFVEPLPKLKASLAEMISPGRAAELVAEETKAREAGRRAACSSNLKQVVMALQMHRTDGGSLGLGWVEGARKYLGGNAESTLRCPSRREVGVGFALNEALIGATSDRIWDLDETVLLFESSIGGDSPIGGARDVPEGGVHDGRVHVGFADGHVQLLPVAEAKKLLNAPGGTAR